MFVSLSMSVMNLPKKSLVFVHHISMHGCHGDRMLKIAGWRTGAVYCIDHRLTPSLIFNSKISPSNKTASLSIVSLQRMFFPMPWRNAGISSHFFIAPLPKFKAPIWVLSAN